MKKSISSISSIYFDRFSFCEKQLSADVAKDLQISVVIPCFNEVDLGRSLEALQACEISAYGSVEVIVVVNHSENASEEIKTLNKAVFNEGVEFAKKRASNQIIFHFIEAFDLPKKHAGVGLARKIGMDEALRRFAKIERDGIIVCFDADSLCEKNYLLEIDNHFRKFPKTPGCSIHYEHPIGGGEYSEEVYSAIIAYELHLRYYKNALKFAGLPYAFHTIGSSMAVRASSYAKQGGMNKRKAGEDFYFLSKIIELGNFTELSATKVIPSPRVSDRVPFGTGKAVGDIIGDKQKSFTTYSFQTFIDLKFFVSEVIGNGKEINISGISDLIESFCLSSNFGGRLTEILKNTTTKEAFLQRFFKVFDAFWVLKLVHFSRDNFYSNTPILEAVNLLLKEGYGIEDKCQTEKEALLVFRKLDQ